MLISQVEDEAEGRTYIKTKPYGDDRWRSHRGFRPYFYVDASEDYTLPRGVSGRVVRGDETAYDGTPLDRVVLDTTRDARDARSEADNHYEADIPFERRFCIDELEGAVGSDGSGFDDGDPHVLHLDIETEARGSFTEPTDADDRVVSVSTYSEDARRHVDFLLLPDGGEAGATEPDWDGDVAGGKVHRFGEESELLAALCSFVKKSGVEVVVGWNVAEYDAVYLIERLAKDCLPRLAPGDISPLGEAYVSDWTTASGEERVNPTIKGIDLFDLDDAYRHVRRRDKPDNWKLGTVAEHEGLEAGKIPFDTARAGEVWDDDPMLVMEYNRRDAWLTRALDGEMGLVEQFLGLHRSLAIPLEDTIKNSVMVEMYVMSRAPAWGIDRRILDSKRTQTNDFEGGNTKQPNPGVYENVFSVDVTSEYPNWVRAANISPETAVIEGDEEWGRGDLVDTPVDGVRFLPHDDRLGILPRAVDEMFGLKADATADRDAADRGSDEWERAVMMRGVAKALLNSIQGVTGMETHRLSKNECSAAITGFGRETVEYMKDVAEEWGYRFVYADTDSVFLHDPDGDLVGSTQGAVDAAHSVASRVNDGLPRWAAEEYGMEPGRTDCLEVEPDKVAKRAMFPDKKKRYTLWLAWKDGDEVDKISHTGWAIVRSDTSELEGRCQRKTLEAIMHGKGEDYITGKLNDEIEAVVAGDYEPIEAARPQGSSKPFAAYGDNPGTLDFENVPYFVAAMVSSNELLGTDFRGGDKAWMLPVRPTETVERNGTTNEVNYLAIDDDTELPPWVEPDVEKIVDNVVGKVRRIYTSLGWDIGRVAAGDYSNVSSANRSLAAFST